MNYYDDEYIALRILEKRVEGVCVDGGMTPSRRSTANHAADIVSTTHSIQLDSFRGTPWRTLAKKPQWIFFYAHHRSIGTYVH